MASFVAFHTHRNKTLWPIILTLPFWTSYLLRVFACVRHQHPWDSLA